MIGANQECYLTPTQGKNFYGDKTEGKPILRKCRYKEKYQLVKNRENEEVLSSLEFTFDEETDVNLDMSIKLTLDGISHQIISISPKRFMSGDIAYKKVYAK
jgi:hypothetical protein